VEESSLSVAPPPGLEPITKRRLWLILGALLLGMLLAALDGTIVSTALPTIVGELHGGSHLSWVVTAYLLSSTVSTPLWGKLGDQYGRKFFFQASIVIFVVGSALSGFSHTMTELIAFRAIQGLGGGGLLVGSQTIVGDVVSPRERGRYMGLFGAMFGVATVIGPLIGGLCVTYLSWRWVFYINLPVGILALFVTGAVLPGSLERLHHAIDYLGTVLLSGAATVLIIFTSLGGVSWAWGSGQSIGLAVGGVVLTIVFLVMEQRAEEPVLPLRLFKVRVFTTASAIGFVVGFAMFGAMTFLPVFLQTVKNVSPTLSGVRLFPLMLGLLGSAIVSGRLVTRWGRYKVFPLIGGVLMTLGSYLMSLIGVHTGAWVMAAYMLIFGIGLGLIMQVLVVAVQNAVSYQDLGVATSNAVFFRMIGGSFGTAVFGAIYTNVLSSKVRPVIGTLPKSLVSKFNFEALDPSLLHTLARLDPLAYDKVLGGITSAVQTVFLVAVPIAAVAFGLSWLLPELALRKTIETVDIGEGFGMPESRSSLQEIQLALERVSNRENRKELYENLAHRAGIDLPARSCWLLYRLADQPASTVREVAKRLKVDRDILEPAVDGLVAAGMVSEVQRDGDRDLVLTPEGVSAIDRLTEARRAGLTELLEGWNPREHPEVLGMVRDLAGALLADDERLVGDALPLEPAAAVEAAG
jgi:EmrB/QacA subfamily drug resistance transporter